MNTQTISNQTEIKKEVTNTASSGNKAADPEAKQPAQPKLIKKKFVKGKKIVSKSGANLTGKPKKADSQ